MKVARSPTKKISIYFSAPVPTVSHNRLFTMEHYQSERVKVTIDENYLQIKLPPNKGETDGNWWQYHLSPTLKIRLTIFTTKAIASPINPGRVPRFLVKVKRSSSCYCVIHRSLSEGDKWPREMDDKCPVQRGVKVVWWNYQRFCVIGEIVRFSKSLTYF